MGYNRSGFQRRRYYSEPTEIICAQCGKKDTVPFKPREGSEVLCRECFLKKKGITPRKPIEPVEPKEKTEEEVKSEEVEKAEESEEEF